MGKVNDTPRQDQFGVSQEIWDRLVNEFRSYRDRQAEYLLKYEGKFLILNGLQVAGAFGTYDEAYDFAAANFDPNTYLLQKCTQGDKEYAMHLPVRFFA
jgi:hypothetical protein